MKLPETLNIICSKNLFLDYYLNDKHYFGVIKKKKFESFGISNQNFDSFLERVKSIPLENEYKNLEIIYKLGLIYKIEYLTLSTNETNRKFYLKTFWIYKNNSSQIELINLILI
ncbi:MAG: DUF6883 domain-containing protein [Ignavibacteriaceae bacterium]